MKTIVVYYSMNGNTALAARMITDALGADTLRIEPEKQINGKSVLRFLWGGKSAVMEETPALRPYEFRAGDYGQVIFGFPVWAGNVTPPLRTFIRDNAQGLKGKRLAAFACQSGSGAQKAFAKLKDCLGGAALEASLVLIDPKDRPDPANADKIKAFCDSCRRGL